MWISPFLSVQQAQRFADDSSAQSSVVRLNTREQNTSSRTTLYLYSEVARLILPDKSAVAPVNTQQLAARLRRRLKATGGIFPSPPVSTSAT